MPNFAYRLKQLRLERKKTQKELALYLKVSQNAIFNWENGNREPNIEMLKKIADYFDVSLDYLMGGIDKAENTCEMHIINTERELIQKYRALNPHGKKIVDFTLNEEWEHSISTKKYVQKIIPMTPKDDPMYVNAAHADNYADAPEELKQQEEDIMDDKNF